jgi:hypothetical protein
VVFGLCGDFPKDREKQGNDLNMYHSVAFLRKPENRSHPLLSAFHEPSYVTEV